ncbi:hypothetical protein [Rhodococcus phenolicus]|uniref:hypothetical protein n=1 Tax=Rhodococcus phenolicus TaxID=263849 RepID=UPI00082D1CDF|nr:hypothetical protein [Rhodococcus phenolicus]
MYALSPEVKLVAPPLIYVDGRVYRLGPAALAVVDMLVDPTAEFATDDLDEVVLARLLDLGIVIRDGAVSGVATSRMRHPLAIHVRSYSTTLLRLLRHAGALYPFKTTVHAGLAIAAGLMVFVWVLRDVHMTGGVAALLTRISIAEIIVAVLFSAIAMMLHEAAHVAATRHAGYPVVRAGLGIYLTRIVCFVDLSALDQAAPSQRRHADLAGMATDSALMVVVWFLGGMRILPSDFAALVAVGYISSLLFSLNPWAKSDAYWLLRDCHPRPTFDPSNWLLQPRLYLARAFSRHGSDTALLRHHLTAGVIWLIVSIGWAATVAMSFLNQPSYDNGQLGSWVMTAVTVALSLVGLSAVALAFLKGSQWRNS